MGVIFSRSGRRIVSRLSSAKVWTGGRSCGGTDRDATCVAEGRTTPRRAAVFDHRFPSQVRPLVAAARAMALLVVVGASATGGQARVDAPTQPPLASHRAVYDFTLGQVRGNAVAEVSGRMVFEYTGSACAGHTQRMRFATRTVSPDGQVSLSDQRSTSWENNQATRFRFQSSHYRNRKLVERTAGTATRSSDRKADLSVQLTLPHRRKTAVGGLSLFPVEHSLRLIEAAQRGDRVFRAEFFDGSEQAQRTYVVHAVIGRPLSAERLRQLPSVGQSDKLEGVTAWPIALSFFEHGSETKDAVPAYEMSYIFYENGVGRNLTIDTGDYTLTGKLVHFTVLDAPPCRR